MHRNIIRTAVILGCITAACIAFYVSAHDQPSRSSHWPKARAEYLLKHGECAACGASGSGVDLEVHHIVPFHVDRAKELDEKNFITLCRNGGHLGCACHLTFGHAGSYSRWNEHVREDAKLMRARLDEAKSRRLVNQ